MPARAQVEGATVTATVHVEQLPAGANGHAHALSSRSARLSRRHHRRLLPRRRPSPRPRRRHRRHPSRPIRRVPPIPALAAVEGVSGYFQSLGLSCESRSASDWARFFGVSIGELEFQERLPRSDNPEQGFVGNPRDTAGMIPPNSYGVHAGPVAELLRSYGLPAEARRWMSFEDLQQEIAAGQPVIVWVIGGVLPGRAVEYTASDGQTTVVAAMEHTVMIVGYSESMVQVVDGGSYYSVSVSRFLTSWGVLENQAVVYDE